MDGFYILHLCKYVETYAPVNSSNKINVKWKRCQQVYPPLCCIEFNSKIFNYNKRKRIIKRKETLQWTYRALLFILFLCRQPEALVKILEYSATIVLT